MTDEQASNGPRYARVVLKLSGESFAHAGERGIEPTKLVEVRRPATVQLEEGHEPEQVDDDQRYQRQQPPATSKHVLPLFPHGDL